MPKTTQFNVDVLRTEAVRPLYVVAGATDLAVEIARGYVNEAQVKVTGAQKKATERVQSVDLEPKALQSRAVELVNSRVDGLTKDAKARQARLEKAVADLQQQARSFPGKVEAYVNDTVTDLNETYAELAVRGEKLVTKLRRQQASQDLKAATKTTASKAKATRTTAKKGATATRSNAKATGTAARKTAKKSTKAVSDASGKVGA